MHKGPRYVIDIECDSLTPTIIHVVVLKDIDTNIVSEYYKDNGHELAALLDVSSTVIGHNIIDFDLPVLSSLWSISVDRTKVVDTLILSRLLRYDLDGGHSLDEWGTRLSFPKQAFTDFSKCTPEMVEYCKNDVELNHKLYTFLIEKLLPMGDKPIEVEHQIAFICRDMHNNGFAFDIKEAKVLLTEINKEIEELDKEIQLAFPPRLVPVREVTPSLTKHGTINRKDFRWYKGSDYTMFQEGCPFTLVEYEPFNPGSTRQIIDRISKYWSPIDKTDGHLLAIRNKDKEKLEKYKTYGWRINETNLATLSEYSPSAARQLVRRILLSSRQRLLDDWSNLGLADGRIHGRFNGIGTWTHRMSHVEPNMGNISANKSIKYTSKELNSLATTLGGRMRGLFLASPGMALVGTDAEGIQLRIFAHLINDPKFAKSLIEGKKEDGTDPHSINQRILNALSRDDAKTFIYAFLLGAGIGKIKSILKQTTAQATQAKESFIEAYPGLKFLKSTIIPRDAERGYFIGLDGRFVVCSSEHLMLAGYLQNAEACIMKHANVLWRNRLDEMGIFYRQVNFVHDEWQTECYPEHAELVAKVQCKAITDVGVMLNVRCPLSGSSSIGANWRDTH